MIYFFLFSANHCNTYYFKDIIRCSFDMHVSFLSTYFGVVNGLEYKHFWQPFSLGQKKNTFLLTLSHLWLYSMFMKFWNDLLFRRFLKLTFLGIAINIILIVMYNIASKFHSPILVKNIWIGGIFLNEHIEVVNSVLQ